MLELLKVGYCTHPEAIVMQGGRWRNMQFPAIVGLIKHPSQGYILFDTGYAKHFMQHTQPFPERLYRWLTPVSLCDKEKLITQLAARNIAADEIKTIFISHFHGDHIAGLLDFPNARFICSRDAIQRVFSSSRIKALIKGYLPSLIPSDFLTRCEFIEDKPLILLKNSMQLFEQIYDIFNDGSCLAVSLPGHAIGHYGLFLASQNKSCFLIGDAAWTCKAYQEQITPHRLSHLIMDNAQQYLETLDKLSRLYLADQQIQIIPSHCLHTYEAFLA